jgi:hypothetical protein
VHQPLKKLQPYAGEWWIWHHVPDYQFEKHGTSCHVSEPRYHITKELQDFLRECDLEFKWIPYRDYAMELVRFRDQGDAIRYTFLFG